MCFCESIGHVAINLMRAYTDSTTSCQSNICRYSTRCEQCVCWIVCPDATQASAYTHYTPQIDISQMAPAATPADARVLVQVSAQLIGKYVHTIRNRHRITTSSTSLNIKSQLQTNLTTPIHNFKRSSCHRLRHCLLFHRVRKAHS